MTVKIFAGETSNLNLAPSAHTGELEGIIKICRNLWSAFSQAPQLYAVIANLTYPRADIVILTERGFGVVELKNNAGKIHCYHQDQWYANEKPIHAGAEYRSNPHEQVKQYARKLRNQILAEFAPRLWPNYLYDLQKMNVHTAVCFTHPRVDISELVANYRPSLDSWEIFKIIKPEDIAEWVYSWRFGIEVRKKSFSEPFTISASEVEFLVQFSLKNKEWKDIYPWVYSNEPYGYLVIAETEEKYIMPLRDGEVWVGRDTETCQVIIPARYEKVSRKHARIERRPEGIFFQDQSKNGTFLGGIRLDQEIQLQDHALLILGGQEANDRTCTIRFLSDPEEVIRLRTTELELRYVDRLADLPVDRTSFLGKLDQADGN
jgi:hypothetical protein